VHPLKAMAAGTLEDMEIEAIRTALIEADWNVSAARKLGLTRAKFDYRIKKFHLMPGS
jgi:transcriptional regulator with GAF, ATPase, and Fis domain